MSTQSFEAIEQPHFENMSKRKLLEGMTPAQLRELRVELLCKLSELESDVHLINDVLGGMGYE